MTPDFDRLAAQIAMNLAPMVGPNALSVAIRAALHEAWNAAIEAAADACESRANWNHVGIGYAESVRAKKLPTGAP